MICWEGHDLATSMQNIKHKRQLASASTPTYKHTHELFLHSLIGHLIKLYSVQVYTQHDPIKQLVSRIEVVNLLKYSYF